MKMLQLFITFICTALCLRGQPEPPRGFLPVGDSLSVTKLAVTGGVSAAAFVYGHAWQTTLWWKGEKSKFHSEWKRDWTYALGSDKFGHFYFPMLVTNLYADVFQWCGVNRKQSYRYAALAAFSYQTFIEVKDGFSKQWGFSWGDFAANTLGAAYPLLQEANPGWRNVQFKISYRASPRFKQNSHSTIIDDYESTYNWVSINPSLLLPAEARRFVPEFINLAVGHSVKRLDTPGGGNHEWFIGLDWNTAALPGDGALLTALKRLVSFYHLPAPAVRVYPGVTWYGLMF